jgi:hypothetical protein
VDDKLNQYSDVLSRLVREMIACTPREWNEGTLTIDCDGVRIDYRLNNEAEPSKAVISEEFRTLIEELYVEMNHHGETWTQATISYCQEGTGAKFDTSFVYAKPAESK